MILSNRTYDILKYIAQILLPALATLVVGICELWTIPNGALIGGTIMLVDTFLGALLKISTDNYNKKSETE